MLKNNWCESSAREDIWKGSVIYSGYEYEWDMEIEDVINAGSGWDIYVHGCIYAFDALHMMHG